ncbi:MAG: hypothetical protein H3C35_13120 [Bacteroidetes bacterium]|nr:hypothetical protein [Bacteroidota bacterium]
MPQVEFSRIFSTAKSALLILPEKADERKTALPFLTQMQTKFSGNNLTVVVNNSIKDIPTTVARSKVVIISREQRNFFFLPRSLELSELFKKQFDCVIDLNIALEPAATFICKKIRSQLKIGFVKEHSDVFYNFQINPNEKTTMRQRYEQLFKTLTMF